MDHRLDGGREHLARAEDALARGERGRAREHFDAALAFFRAPELRLGEAHALRGLAQVQLAGGAAAAAEALAREAVVVYEAVVDQVQRLRADAELAEGARDGLAATLALLADVLVRLGRAEDARAAIGRAQIVTGDREIHGAATVYSGLGRLALREGRYDQAEAAFDRALSIHASHGDVAGQVGAAMAFAEMWRVSGRLDAALGTLDAALSLARERELGRLEGRVLAALGAVLLQQGRQGEARAHYEAALVKGAGDLETEGYAMLGLGELASRAGQPSAAEMLLRGARALARLDHAHGVGGAMLRLSEHALRVGDPDLALVAAEAARRLWRASDPVRGVGQALRLVVKALAARRRWRVAFVAARLRAEVAGALQPNAIEVARWYSERAPGAWAEELRDLPAAGLDVRLDRALEPLVGAVLGEAPTPAGALAAVEALTTGVAAHAPYGDAGPDDAGFAAGDDVP